MRLTATTARWLDRFGLHSSSSAILSLLPKCHTINHLKQIHCILVTIGLSRNTTFLSELICSLITLDQIPYASVIFDKIDLPTVSLWNNMIQIFSTSSKPHEAIAYYFKMRQSHAVPNKHTFPALLKAISKCDNVNPFHFYAEIVKLSLNLDPFVRNSLISASANCGFVEFARLLFDESTWNDMISWTSMIDGYVRNNISEEGLKLFLEMRLNDVSVDEVTIVNVLRASAMVGNVWFGMCVQGFYVEPGRVSCDVYVGSALIDMYCKCGYLDHASKVFDEMPCRNVVSWSAIISGYVQGDRHIDALRAFQGMLLVNVKPNQTTLSSVLAACAQLGALDQGQWVHQYIDRNKLELNSILGTALIDMYAKSGCVDDAFLVFNRLAFKNVYPWTAMINGLAMHGDASSCLNLFKQMIGSGVQPNEVTFISILSACSHRGLISEGRQLFRLMGHAYCLKPSVDHYGCMVDLLSRAGHLNEAIKLIEEMPMEPTPGIWGALLSSCVVHKAYELGKLIGKHLISLQPSHSGRYMLLANLYSLCEHWEAAARVRKSMRRKGLEKTRGGSWMEVNGVIHEFISFDGLQTQMQHLYVTLDTITAHSKFYGYNPGSHQLPFVISGGFGESISIS
ncbi:hypothetical protein Nepgr_013774 [Nepenthes gracilis]|uniref:Pentatricopeptide repeat-containing protein n=1 Tax=Nepenthes gracilis TaxID=150966 RepID=A0AAD3SIN0_NEPGR|nr:hypothetical protein Nepgr_013774 [Nepenthes gracilis]